MDKRSAILAVREEEVSGSGIAAKLADTGELAVHAVHAVRRIERLQGESDAGRIGREALNQTRRDYIIYNIIGIGR